MSDPATYCASTPRIQLPAVAQWHSHLHGLATAIHETSGLVLLGHVLGGIPRNKPQKNPAQKSGVLLLVTVSKQYVIRDLPGQHLEMRDTLRGASISLDGAPHGKITGSPAARPPLWQFFQTNSSLQGRVRLVLPAVCLYGLVNRQFEFS